MAIGKYHRTDTHLTKRLPVDEPTTTHDLSKPAFFT